jgi:predicted nucleotide-binding protein
MVKRSDDNSISREDLDSFLQGVPNNSEVTNTPELLVAHFGYFLTDRLGEQDITPKKIRSCYDAAVVPAPANIPYVMKKSKAFVRTSQGTKLSREVRARIHATFEHRVDAVPVTASLDHQMASADKTRNVVVVHGRDTVIRDSMFQFLTSLRLNPIEWNEAVRRTALGSPYIGQVLDALFRDAQAIVVILSPDESVELRHDLRTNDSNDDHGWQPRPNVFVEAGMALAKDEPHTILVRIDVVRVASDLLGRNLVNLDDSSAQRHTLAQRLLTAGCSVVTTGTDWLRVGTFIVRSPISMRRRKK